MNSECGNSTLSIAYRTMFILYIVKGVEASDLYAVFFGLRYVRCGVCEFHFSYFIPYLRYTTGVMIFIYISRAFFFSSSLAITNFDVCEAISYFFGVCVCLCDAQVDYNLNGKLLQCVEWNKKYVNNYKSNKKSRKINKPNGMCMKQNGTAIFFSYKNNNIREQ